MPSHYSVLLYIASAGCTWCIGRSSVYLCSNVHSLLHAEPHSTAALLCITQYLYGTILLTACLMVWDCCLHCFFVDMSCSLHFCLSLFSPFLPVFYGLDLWGWGLWTDRVHSLTPSLEMLTFKIITIIALRTKRNSLFCTSLQLLKKSYIA